MIYQNNDPRSRIASVEFSKVGEAQLSFIHLRPSANSSEVESWLKTPSFAQEIISSTTDGNHTLIVARGSKAPEEILSELANRHESLSLPTPEKKKFNPWLWRGISSFVGQSLQIASSKFAKNPQPGDRAAIAGFATLNLIANTTNIIFGAQKKPDAFQLEYLKSEFNEKIKDAIGNSADLPSIHDDCYKSREAELPPKTTGQKIYDTVQKYSVSGGEIGLRTIGATSLVVPVTKWGEALKTLKASGSIGEAFRVARNKNPYTYVAGILTLLGKGTSFLSKEKDPFNPKRERTTFDKIREDYTFPASSVIEAAGAGIMTYDRFKNQKININGKDTADYLGGTGNAVFIGGYGIRFMAPYGSLEVDMKELIAHMSDGLAKAPREKLPMLMAETAVELKEHFKDKNMTVSDIYSKLASDLESHHKIPIPAPGYVEPYQPQPVPGTLVQEPMLAMNSNAKQDISRNLLAETPALMHQEKIQSNPSMVLG